jgi:hypothetical protein
MKNLFFKLIIFTIIISGYSVIHSQKVPTTIAEMYPNEEITIINGRNPQKNSEGSWFQGSNMPHARYYSGSVMYTINDTSWLYVFGGDTTGGGHPTTACLRYNVNTDTWEYIAPLPEPMRVNAAARLGDKLYTMGGFNAPFPATSISSFYEYDVNTNTWTQLPDLPIPMFFIGAEGYQDSIIYIIGGFTDTSSTNASDLAAVTLDEARVFNRNNLSFRNATRLIQATANFSHTILRDEIFVIAGLKNDTELLNLTQEGKISALDRAQITWTLKANYPLLVHGHYSYAVSFNELYTGGGSPTVGFDPTDELYGYDRNTNMHKPEPPLPYKGMAFAGGVNYDFSNNDDPEILKIVIAGGITTGPTLTAQTWVFTDTMAVKVEAVDNTLPEEYSLAQNYPNPFNPATTIEFALPQSSFVNLEVFNALGEKVSSLVSEELSAGTYKYKWNAEDLTSGIYFYRITTESFIESKKMILLK